MSYSVVLITLESDDQDRYYVVTVRTGLNLE